MEAGHLGMADHIPGHIRAGTGNEVDDASRQAAPHQQLHVVVVGQHGGAGGLPNGDIAHDGGGGGQVSADGGEVEGRDGADKAIQGAVILAVPDPVHAEGLVLEDLLGGPDAEAEEVGQLGNVDLRLEHGLGLPQHGGGVEHLAVGAGDQVSGLQEDSGAVLPGHLLPGILRGQSRFHGHFQFLLPCHAALSDDVLMVVGDGDLDGFVRPDLFPADDEGDLHHLSGLPGQLGLQLSALRTAGQIALKGVVGGFGNGKIGIGHGSSSFLHDTQ